MITERLRQSDLDTVMTWWSYYHRVKVPMGLFTEDYAFGAYDDEELVASLFFYPIMGSNIALVGWPCADHKASKGIRNLALNLLYDKVHYEAKEMGYSHLWTVSGISAVEQRLIDLGYKIGDTGINQYWKEL